MRLGEGKGLKLFIKKPIHLVITCTLVGDNTKLKYRTSTLWVQQAKAQGY